MINILIYNLNIEFKCYFYLVYTKIYKIHIIKKYLII